MVSNPYDCRIRCLWAKRKMFMLVPVPQDSPVVPELCGHGLGELDGKTRKRRRPDRIIPSSCFYKTRDACSSQLLNIWRFRLAKRSWESKGSRYTEEPCYLGDSFPFPHSLKPFWQRRGKNKRRSPPKSEAKRHWTAAWKWNVLIALIKMQRGCKRSGVGDKETTLNGRSFIFRTPKCPEPCPGEFRGFRALLAPLDDLVTYFIVHWSIPRVTGELGAVPDTETVPEVLNSINGTTFPRSFN